MIKTLTILTYLLGGTESHQLPMELSSVAVNADGKLPVVYTCRGKSISIPLKWQHIPPGTRSLALIMFDKSAPKQRRYLWAVYNISPQRRWIEPAAKLFRGEQYAENSWGHLSYDVPCPSPGKAHHYVIKLYALKARFYFHKQVTAQELRNAMEHRVISTAEMEIRFASPKRSG